MGICYIVGAGSFYHGFTPYKEDLVIAADGGYDTLISHGLRCDLVIGDCDSLNTVPSDVECIRHPIEKDETDCFLAFFEGMRRGYRQFEIYGGTGGREDHTQANLALLLYAGQRGCQARLWGEQNVSEIIINEKRCFSLPRGKHFSAFAFGGDAAGVTISGAYYEAKDITLSPAFPLCTSNLSVGKEIFASVKRGALLIMCEI
jgi:thiamine pyrophosphokinase